MTRAFRYILCLLGGLFLVWTVYTSLTQVQSHERAVIRRFGRILEQKPQQGLYIGLPWGIDRVDLAPVGRVRSITVGVNDKEEKDDETVPSGQLLTGDHNLVNVQASINFKVRAEKMDRYVLQQDSVDAFVARAAESLLAEWIAGRTIDFVIKRGKSELPAFLLRTLQERIEDYDLGVDIEQASIIRLDPPDQVKDAFDRVAQAQTNIRTQINRAEEIANSKRRASDAEIAKIDRQAISYAAVERDKATTDAANFRKRLDVYRELSAKNPDYLNTLWLEEMTQLFTRLKGTGQIGVLDHYLMNGELTITQFPMQPKKK
jgi:membrane protease subunit HflK